MRHRLCDTSTYELDGLRKGDEHPSYILSLSFVVQSASFQELFHTNPNQRPGLVFLHPLPNSRVLTKGTLLHFSRLSNTRYHLLLEMNYMKTDAHQRNATQD